jgi:hypothetical protein
MSSGSHNHHPHQQQQHHYPPQQQNVWKRVCETIIIRETLI